ncbi:MAG: diguanylate cyclase [Candidatus Hydrogenedentes bacterium]|nr:diguanylate cyclase [Candidatus Hydrogenedentota bacterium]
MLKYKREYRGTMLAAVNEQYSDRSVLVVATDPGDRDSLAETLRTGFDCEVTSVDSNKTALEHLANARVDVLISSAVSPDADGLAPIREYRRVSPDTNLIVVTNSPDEFPRVDAVRAGADDIIASGHPRDELTAILLRVFRDKDMRAQSMTEEQRYRKIFEYCIGGNLILHQPTSQILDVNRAFCALTGIERDQILGKTLYDILDENQHERFKEVFSIFERTGQGMVGDIKLHHVDGHQMSVDVSVTFINDSDDPIVHVAFVDVTERRRVEQELVSAVQTDALTGLLNKRSLMNNMDIAFTRARIDRIPVSLLFIDLDNFKRCNDTHGHQTGDGLLAATGEVIRKSIRLGGGDEGFRYGGDEFAVLLMGTPKENVSIVVDRIRSEFEKIERYGTTMSIGVAEFVEGMRPETLIELADSALYEAKAAGKDTVRVS